MATSTPKPKMTATQLAARKAELERSLSTAKWTANGQAQLDSILSAARKDGITLNGTLITQAQTAIKTAVTKAAADKAAADKAIADKAAAAKAAAAKPTTTTPAKPTGITGAAPPASLKLPDAATAVSLINQRAPTAPPTMKTDSATGVSYYLVPPAGSQPARWEAVNRGASVSNNGLSVKSLNQTQTTYFSANQAPLPKTADVIAKEAAAKAAADQAAAKKAADAAAANKAAEEAAAKKAAEEAAVAKKAADQAAAKKAADQAAKINQIRNDFVTNVINKNTATQAQIDQYIKDMTAAGSAPDASLVSRAQGYITQAANAAKNAQINQITGNFITNVINKSTTATQAQIDDYIKSITAAGGTPDASLVSRAQGYITQAANAAKAAQLQEFRNEITRASNTGTLTKTQVADIASRAEKAGTPLSANEITSANESAQKIATSNYNTQISNIKTQAELDSVLKQAQDQGITVNPAAIQQAQGQIKSGLAQVEFAKSLGEPTGFGNKFGPNGQNYESVARDPITGAEGGWYKQVGNDLQKVDAEGQATGPIIPRDQFVQMAQTARVNTELYNKQITQQQAAQKLATDVQSFEAALAAPGSEQFQYLLANRFPVTGPDGRDYEPVAQNLATGEPAKWIVSKSTSPNYANPNEQYTDLGNPNATVIKKDINQVFETNNQITTDFNRRLENATSRDQYNQILQEGQGIGVKFDKYAMARANDRIIASEPKGGGLSGLFSAFDDLVNDTIGWRNIASIVGSAVIPGPWGATLGRAVAGAVAGDDLEDIAKGAALTFAATYGVQQLSNALAETAQAGAELGIEGADDLASQISNNTQVFDDGSVLISDANGMPVGGVDIDGAEFVVNNGVGTYVGTGLPLGGTPELNFGGASNVPVAPQQPVAPEVPETMGPPVEAMEPVAPQQPTAPAPDNTVTQVFDDGSTLTTDATTGQPVSYTDTTGAVTTVPTTPQVPAGDIVYSDITGQEVDLTSTVGGEPTIQTGGNVIGTDPVTGEPILEPVTARPEPLPPGETGGYGDYPEDYNIDITGAQNPDLAGTGPVTTTPSVGDVSTPGGVITIPSEVIVAAPVIGGVLAGAGGGGATPPPSTPAGPVEPTTPTTPTTPPVEPTAPVEPTTPVEPTAPPTTPTTPPVETPPDIVTQPVEPPPVVAPPPTTPPTTPTTPPVEPTTPTTPVEPTTPTTPPVEPTTPPTPPVEIPPVIIPPVPTTPPVTPTTPPVTPTTPGGTTPGGTTPGGTTPGGTTPGGTTPGGTTPGGTTPGGTTPGGTTPPPAQPEVPVVDKSRPLTPEEVAELEQGRIPGGVNLQDIWNAVSIGLLAPSIITALFTPKPPPRPGYGPLDPIDWGSTGRTLTGLGVNPGWVMGPSQVPMYQTTNPYQSQFFWGKRPGYNTLEELAQNYNRPPGAPAQGYGLQAGPEQFDVNQYIQSLSQNMPAAPGPIAPSVPAYTPPAFPRL